MAVTALTPTDPTTDPTAVPKPTPATKPAAATPMAPLTNPVPNTPAAPTATTPKPMIDPAPPIVSAPVGGPPANGVSSIPGIAPAASSTAASGLPASGMQSGAPASAASYTGTNGEFTGDPNNVEQYRAYQTARAEAQNPALAKLHADMKAAGLDINQGYSNDQIPADLQAEWIANLTPSGSPRALASNAGVAPIDPTTGLPLGMQSGKASTLGQGNVTTLANGVLSQNGKPIAVGNEFGNFVDPTTGQMTSAGGVIGAQAGNGIAGLPSTVNGTPIAQWMQSMGIAPQGTPDATGSLMSVGGANGSGTPGSATPTGGAPGISASPTSGPSATGATTANSPISTLLPNGPTTSGAYANTQQIVPGGATDLTSQLITPGAGTDRLQLAKQYEDAWNAATNPQFAADQRDALRSAAAGGALGSGQLNTNLGSLTANRDIQRNAAMQNFLTNAQEGSIEDAFRKLGILQQQQGFQAGQQNTAFNQGLLQNEVGNMNNPDTLLAELAAQYNQQAGQAAGSVGQLAQASSANQQGQIPAWLLPLLQGYASGGSSNVPVSTATGGY